MFDLTIIIEKKIAILVRIFNADKKHQNEKILHFPDHASTT